MFVNNPEDGSVRKAFAKGKYQFQPRPAAKQLDKKVT